MRRNQHIADTQYRDVLREYWRGQSTNNRSDFLCVPSKRAAYGYTAYVKLGEDTYPEAFGDTDTEAKENAARKALKALGLLDEVLKFGRLAFRR